MQDSKPTRGGDAEPRGLLSDHPGLHPWDSRKTAHTDKEEHGDSNFQLAISDYPIKAHSQKVARKCLSLLKLYICYPASFHRENRSQDLHQELDEKASRCEGWHAPVTFYREVSSIEATCGPSMRCSLLLRVVRSAIKRSVASWDLLPRCCYGREKGGGNFCSVSCKFGAGHRGLASCQHGSSSVRSAGVLIDAGKGILYERAKHQNTIGLFSSLGTNNLKLKFYHSAVRIQLAAPAVAHYRVLADLKPVTLFNLSGGFTA